jgi:uncharacterized protein
MTDVLSPCRKICVLDASKTWCTACGRTLDEIANWSQASETEQQAIVEQLPERLVQLKSSRELNQLK